MSTGRGGAGNIGKERRESFTKPEDLKTPVLKGEMYTTGRGGTGNMAKNDKDKPEVARARQDVEAPPPRELKEGEYHYGRGGAANVSHLSAAEAQKQKPAIARKESDKGWADRAKGTLEKIIKK